MIGFLNIIKPTGMSSAFVVNKIKRVTKNKVGHLGTLDPAASGVLTIAVGKATRFFNYFLNKDKEYVALMRFGVLTDTLDSDGTVLKRDDKIVPLEDIEKVIPSLVGEVDQMPPLYSAKSVNGVRAYDAARRGNEIVLSPKKVHIYDLNVQKTTKINIFRLKIHCSAGTYVRSIVRDIAEKLGTVATTIAIIRIRSGAFKCEDAVTLEEVLSEPNKYLIKVNDVLKLAEIELSDRQAKALKDGKTENVNLKDGEYLTYYKGKEFAVTCVKNNIMSVKIYLYEENNND